MTSISAMFEQIISKAALAFRPVFAQWNALEPGPRRLAMTGAILLATGFIAAFIWLPAVRTREALTVRLPHLQTQLADMRSQAQEVKALAGTPAVAPAMRMVADVNALQSVFGTDALITAAQDGFRIVIPAVGYASWWDKTGEALSRHALVLRSASITRINGQKAGGNIVAVEMLLGAEARGAVSSSAPPAPAALSPQGK